MSSHEDWMRQAIAQARSGMAAGQSPFGAVIVRGGELVAGGHNEVWLRTDPTAHAETVAISRAAAALKSIDLSGSVIYTTCEPCPMCAAAIHWAKLDAVYFGATIAHAQGAGFSELIVSIDDLYRRGGSPVKIVPGILTGECAELFEQWRGRPDRKPY